MKFKNYLGLGMIMLSGGVIANMFIKNVTALFVLELLVVIACVIAGYILLTLKE